MSNPEKTGFDQHWCECDCVNCEIGAHERVHQSEMQDAKMEGRKEARKEEQRSGVVIWVKRRFYLRRFCAHCLN